LAWKRGPVRRSGEREDRSAGRCSHVGKSFAERHQQWEVQSEPAPCVRIRASPLGFAASAESRERRDLASHRTSACRCIKSEFQIPSSAKTRAVLRFAQDEKFSLPSASFSLRPRRRNLRETAREEHGIEFRANQDHQRDQVHPDQQRNAQTERAVDDAVVGVVLQVPSNSAVERSHMAVARTRPAERCARVGCAAPRCDR